MDKVVAEEEKEVYYYLEDTADLYIDWGWQFSFVVIGDSNLVIGVTKFLANDIGHIPLLCIITDDPSDKYRPTIIRELTNLDYGLQPEVIFESNSDEIWKVVKKSEAELILGSSMDGPLARDLTAGHLSISRPTIDRLITNNILCGYRGGLELVSDINTAVMKMSV